MTRAEILYLLPYMVSLALSLGIFMYAWGRRRSKGAPAYLWYVAGQSLGVLSFILELLSPVLAGKLFWDGFQWLSAAIIMAAFPVFAVQYSEHKLRKPALLFRLSLVVPAVFLLLLATDSQHHLIYSNPRLLAGNPFSELAYEFTPAVYAIALYGYAVSFWGIGLLLVRFNRVHDLYRAQVAVIIVGFLIPIIGTILTLSGVQVSPQRDPSPFTSAAANIIIAWGLFHFRLFDIVPVGRDRLFEAMQDPVVILDNRHLVVDINSAMLALLDREATQVIGKPAKQVFDDFPIPIKQYTHVSYARAETTFQIQGKDIYYEMTVWPLHGANKEMTGRIYIAHDITALKELERELRELNSDLEHRVRLRTKELAEAYDTTLEGWAKALELRDKETEGHSRRVTETTVAVAEAMGFIEEELEHIRRGAILHDIGKMGIPDHILRKEGSLTDKERLIVQKHPETARDLLKQIPFLEKALDIPFCHHERWDGAGYPRGLKGREIPLPARIFAVADVWDALLSDRPYRKAWGKEQAMQYLATESGKHFDPRVVNKFLQMVKDGKV